MPISTSNYNLHHFTYLIIEFYMRKSFYSLLAGIMLMAVYSCSDNNIGQSITDTVVTVEVDSSFTVSGKTFSNRVLPARTITQMLGVIKAQNYGELRSDIVSQLMPATLLDTVGVKADDIDSCKFVFQIPLSGGYAGDSIAPMRTTVYRLNKVLPSKLSTDLDPTEYYDEKDVLGSATYTASAIMASDSLKLVYNNSSIREFSVKVPTSFAQEIFKKFKDSKETFQDPAVFANYFPGIYVKNSFGSGRVMNISSTMFKAYYHRHTKTEAGNDTIITKIDMNYMGATPEVVSNNNVSLLVDDNVMSMVNNGDAIIQAPSGFEVNIDFPIQEIIDKYQSGGNSDLAVINDLTFEIPATAVTNDHGIRPPEYLLMVKSSEKDDFFATNHTTDSKSSFYATYNSSTKSYKFTGMRDFVLDIINNKNGIAADADKHFTLAAVDLIAEKKDTSSSSYYYYYYYYDQSSTSNLEVTGIRPAMNKPSIAKLDLSKAKIKLVYSTQSIRNM